MRFPLLLLALAACAPDDELDTGELEPDELAAVDTLDPEDWAADDREVVTPSPTDAAPLGRNGDITTVIVWSQNIRMGLENWRNVVRCMGDRACNGLGAVPDVILLQEASCDNVKALQAQLVAGLGITGWHHFCADNPHSGGVTGHWMSNGIIYRSDRFRLETSANAKRIEFFSGDGTFCRKQGKELPVIKLLDIPRADAGLAEHRITLAVRHDDHFGPDHKTVCAGAGASTTFCDWKNSKLIDNAIDGLGGGLQVMAGDWNYAAKLCSVDGVATHNFKYAYGCTTRGVRSDCAPANLGWRDPILDHDPAFYDTHKVIDFMHGKDIGAVTLNVTPRNHVPGMIGVHFYCPGHGPYSNGGVADHPDRMTDHHGLLMKFHY